MYLPVEVPARGPADRRVVLATTGRPCRPAPRQRLRHRHLRRARHRPRRAPASAAGRAARARQFAISAAEATPGYLPGPVDAGHLARRPRPVHGGAAGPELPGAPSPSPRRARAGLRAATTRRSGAGPRPRPGTAATATCTPCTPTAAHAGRVAALAAGGRAGLHRLHRPQHQLRARRLGPARRRRPADHHRRGGHHPQRPLPGARPAGRRRGSTGATGPRDDAFGPLRPADPPRGRPRGARAPVRALHGLPVEVRLRRRRRDRGVERPVDADDEVSLPTWDNLLPARSAAATADWLPAMGNSDAHRDPDVIGLPQNVVLADDLDRRADPGRLSAGRSWIAESAGGRAGLHRDRPHGEHAGIGEPAQVARRRRVTVTPDRPRRRRGLRCSGWSPTRARSSAAAAATGTGTVELADHRLPRRLRPRRGPPPDARRHPGRRPGQQSAMSLLRSASC